MNIYCDARRPHDSLPVVVSWNTSSRSAISEHQDQSVAKKVLVASIRQYAFVVSLKQAPYDIINI